MNDEPCLSDASLQYQYANEGPSKIKCVMSTSAFLRFGNDIFSPNWNCDTNDHSFGTPIPYLHSPVESVDAYCVNETGDESDFDSRFIYLVVSLPLWEGGSDRRFCI